MLFLRCVALDSDAYPRLSWSSALLTDEGFYLHNARNRVLFGHAQTDQFNNALIMPLLDAMQTGLFRIAGVGAVQARALTVLLALLTLPVFYDALRRAFGLRTALWGLLLLGLDHVSLLYGRLALMDTPAAFVLVCGFWLWVKSGEGVRRERFWLAGCGVVLGLCYGVRGLGALVYPVPALLLCWEGWKGRHGGEQGEGSRGAFWNLAFLLGGLALALGVYGAVWYLPHRAELARVNHYYLLHQLLPHSLNAVRLNVSHALFGDQRGYSPYLFRHTPVVFVLALLGFAVWAIKRGRVGLRDAPRRNALYLGLWLLIAWAVFGCVSYAPPRYYVIFYPALAGIAALVLEHVGTAVRIVMDCRTARVLLGSFLAYHLCESVLSPASAGGDFVLYGLTTLVGLSLFFLRPGRRRGKLALAWRRPTAAFALWAVINALWLGDWITHLHYAQRDADRWLAANLPPQSVLIGDAAPGLCLNSRFVVVSVIPGLCNDNAVLEAYAGQPRYLVLLDGQQKLDWWRARYPEVIRAQNLKRRFPRLINFAVTVYAVPMDAVLPSALFRKK